MLRGFYTAASGMIAQQRKTELLTNNLSNVNTPGYKAEQAGIRSFPDMLLSRLQYQSAAANGKPSPQHAGHIGTLSTGVYMQETLPNFIQGQLMETELATDMSISDGALPAGAAVFFTLAAEDGGRTYTRNGNFTIDAEGFLVNAHGQYVLTEDGGRIALAHEEFSVSPEGWIMQDGEQIARLGLSLAAEPQTLLKDENGLFRTEAGEALPSVYETDAAVTVRQGYLEQSNVDSSRSMTDLMTAYRAFEANQKVLQAYDRSMEKAVNEIGRVN